MEKLFEILAKGEMPDFLQMMQALNEISDIDWQAKEAAQLSITDVFQTPGVCRHPQICPGEFCDVCG